MCDAHLLRRELDRAAAVEPAELLHDLKVLARRAAADAAAAAAAAARSAPSRRAARGHDAAGWKEIESRRAHNHEQAQTIASDMSRLTGSYRLLSTTTVIMT